jgi:hypothetical protein
MTERQINIVLKKIAEIADGNESKPIAFCEIRDDTHIDHDELEKILLFLGNEGYIKNRHKLFIDLEEIFITHKGIRKSLSFI